MTTSMEWCDCGMKADADRATTLWHFTCSCGRDDLGGRSYLLPISTLRPDVQVPLGTEDLLGLIWMTSNEHGAGAGLTMSRIACDRREFRYRVLRSSQCLPWVEARESIQLDLVRELEAAKDVDPSTWWVSREPVAVVYDPDPARWPAAIC